MSENVANFSRKESWEAKPAGGNFALLQKLDALSQHRLHGEGGVTAFANGTSKTRNSTPNSAHMKGRRGHAKVPPVTCDTEDKISSRRHRQLETNAKTCY